VGNWSVAEAASYAIALTEAEIQQNRGAIKALSDIGPPPHTVDQLWVECSCLARMEAMPGRMSWWQLGRVLLGGPESSVLDLPALLRGWRFSLDALWPEVSRLDLMMEAPALAMPVFFFLGRRDHWVPPAASVPYFEELRAPLKELVWFEESGHEPVIDEADKFNAAMVELVRPAA
jgi:pimeloyl-ACP methyl ester carboxylesterase